MFILVYVLKHVSLQRGMLKKAKTSYSHSTKLDTHLVDLFFRVCQQIGELCKHIAVENNLRLLISASHDVAHRPQSCCLPFEQRLKGGGGSFLNVIFSNMDTILT